MYKKIKNGSFMNWIWFIVALMPILLLLIYSLSNLLINKSKVKVDNILNYNEQYQETYLENDIKFEKFYNSYFNSNYFLTNYGDNQVINNNNYLELEIYSNEIEDYDTLIYFDNNYEEDYYIYIYLEGEYYNNDNYIAFDYNDNGSIILEQHIVYEFHVQDSGGNGLPMFTMYSNEKVYGNLKIFIAKNKIDKTLFYKLVDWNYIEIENQNNTFYDYLQNFNNTIETNGFISNAFLNLAQFFGVNNVYYSLACYYIEYLLVIVLLHLAFDVLYMLPNICHKFMEKIGGERD